MTLPEFLVKGSPEDLLKYKQLMVNAMKLLGQTNETLIEEDMDKVLENELKLAKLSHSEYSHYISDLGGFYTKTVEEIRDKTT